MNNDGENSSLSCTLPRIPGEASPSHVSSLYSSLGFRICVGNLNKTKTYQEVNVSLEKYFMSQSLLFQDIQLAQSRWVFLFVSLFMWFVFFMLSPLKGVMKNLFACESNKCAWSEFNGLLLHCGTNSSVIFRLLWKSCVTSWKRICILKICTIFIFCVNVT